MAKTKNEVLDLKNFKTSDVPKMLELVKSKIQELTGSSDKKPSTKGVYLPGFDALENMNSLSDLIKAYSSIEGKEKAYEAAFKSMGIKTKMPKFEIEGHSANVWRKDIKLRYQEVAHKSQVEKLNTIKKTLESHLTEEEKFNKDMQNIAELMKEEL